MFQKNLVSLNDKHDLGYWKTGKQHVGLENQAWGADNK